MGIITKARQLVYQTLYHWYTWMFISTQKKAFCFFFLNHQWLSITLRINLNPIPWTAKQSSPWPCSPHLPALLHTSPVMQHRCPSPLTLSAHSLLPLSQKVMLLHLLFRSVLKSHLLSGWTILSTMALPRLSSIPLSCFIFLSSTHHYQKICI